MAEPTQSYVQVAPDSTGKLVKTLETGDSAGNTVEIELSCAVDSTGRPVTLLTEDTGQRILHELKRISFGISALVGDSLEIKGE